MTPAVSILVVLLSAGSYLRWWRVAQREHYAPGRILAMIGIWCRAQRATALVLAGIVLVAAGGAAMALASRPLGAGLGIVAAVAWLTWPAGLALVPDTSRLALTDRVKRLVAVTLVLHLVLGAGLAALGAVALLPVVTPLVLELALLLLAPVEQGMGRKYQVSAATKIRQVHPRVVAITGSYGKTSTKNYATHLISGRWSVLASPASFNNVMGLSRAVNDRLVPGTDVFVAEMGTYGPGEISALCEIFDPEVSAITTIGEAHLERMKDRATIVRAKSEILLPARTVVLNVDVPELAALADTYAASKRVIRCSVTPGTPADVAVLAGPGGWSLVLAGTAHRVDLPAETDHPINVAIAVGLAIALDVPEKTLLERLGTIPATPHRAEASVTASGWVIIDDTYNANPEGAAAALARATELAGEGGTVWTITPGMVELGSEQAARNADLARSATASAQHRLCVVGHTNRAALQAGDPERTELFANREAATQRVTSAAGARDVVLYENDLPDHYP
ncbi:MAG: UDP-N-acetylmuramoyl-tripeptide--D-alanyl-D-alanine ligase [Nocardioides sp.]|nr:UDP-N-acetylmuramoyl-tripeptide--D-alanyl-D-alanine ligase [Nocardioides sp.]